MEFIKRLTHSAFFAAGAGARILRWVAVCALLAAAAHSPEFNGRRAQAKQPETVRGEAAIRRLKTDGGYASLAAAMAGARYQINAATPRTGQAGQFPGAGRDGALYYANNPGQRL